LRLDQNLQMLKQFDKINVSVKNIRMFGYLVTEREVGNLGTCTFPATGLEC
jgi:hypothetical protein